MQKVVRFVLSAAQPRTQALCVLLRGESVYVVTGSSVFRLRDGLVVKLVGVIRHLELTRPTVEVHGSTLLFAQSRKQCPNELAVVLVNVRNGKVLKRCTLDTQGELVRYVFLGRRNRALLFLETRVLAYALTNAEVVGMLGVEQSIQKVFALAADEFLLVLAPRENCNSA